MLGIVLIFAVASVAAHDEEDGDPFFRVGKNGQVTLDTDLWFGDVVLKKGRYTLQHRIEGADHIFVFLDAKRGQQITIHSKRVFPGDGTSESMIHAKEEKDRRVHVTKIELASENMDHTF